MPFQVVNGKLLLRRTKPVDSAQCCCVCQQCASLNTGCCRYVEITLSGSYDSDGTYQAQLPTYGMQNRDGRPQGRGCFDFIGAACGPYGPNGEYGWLLSLSVCGACDPANLAAAWEGFVPLVTDAKGWCCAKTGTVEMTPVMLWDGSADTHGMSITVTVQPGVVISAVGTSGTDFPCSRAYCTDYPNQCPTIGVCCDQFDQATPSTEADCAARGGTFHADGTYDPSMPCVEGLCCMPWGRFPSSAAACGNLGGVFHPNGTFNPANPPC